MSGLISYIRAMSAMLTFGGVGANALIRDIGMAIAQFA